VASERPNDTSGAAAVPIDAGIGSARGVQSRGIVVVVEEVVVVDDVGRGGPVEEDDPARIPSPVEQAERSSRIARRAAGIRFTSLAR
jgi:hypothetical protein